MVPCDAARQLRGVRESHAAPLQLRHEEVHSRAGVMRRRSTARPEVEPTALERGTREVGLGLKGWGGLAEVVERDEEEQRAQGALRVAVQREQLPAEQLG